MMLTNDSVCILACYILHHTSDLETRNKEDLVPACVNIHCYVLASKYDCHYVAERMLRLAYSAALCCQCVCLFCPLKMD